MKKLLSLFLAFILLFSLCACEGNWNSVDLNDPIAIPENGVIQQSILNQLKEENAIGVFTGTCGDFSYEWTVFGSDISQSKEINLGVKIAKNSSDEIEIALNTKEDFGFSALLSITLNTQWNVQSATAYSGDAPAASVSVTGSKATILNLTLDGSAGNLIVRGDPVLEDTPPTEETIPSTSVQTDNYLSKPADNDENVYTGGKDKYLTDPVPAGKPQPVEPENQDVNKGKTYTCIFSIECSTILNNLDMLDPSKLEMVPSGGVILKKTTVTFYEGESVYDVLQRVCQENGIHMEASWTPIYNSAYIEGIHNLYEFDCGALSGWMYKVNGWYPNYGCSRYQLKDGDLVEWRYTCDFGHDIGGSYAVGG